MCRRQHKLRCTDCTGARTCCTDRDEGSNDTDRVFRRAISTVREPQKICSHFSYLSARVYDRDSLDNLGRLERLSPVREVRTLFLRQSILPLLQFWGGRLRLDGFTSTLDTQNVMLGPSAGGGLLDYRPRRQSYPGGPHSVGSMWR